MPATIIRSRACAAFAIAPAIVPALTPDGLARLKTPVAIILGDVDPVAAPENNGLVTAKLSPGAQFKVLPGVGHYDFLNTCTPAAMATIPPCTAKVSQDQSHKAATDMALAFFRKNLGAP